MDLQPGSCLAQVQPGVPCLLLKLECQKKAALVPCPKLQADGDFITWRAQGELEEASGARESHWHVYWLRAGEGDSSLWNGVGITEFIYCVEITATFSHSIPQREQCF